MVAPTTLSQLYSTRATTPRLRPITGRTATPTLRARRTPGRVRLAMPATRPSEQKDVGILGGIKEFFTDIPGILGNVITAAPDFIGSAAQTAANLATLSSGGSTRLVRRSAEDFRTAQREGARGADLFRATLSRDLPLLAEMGPSLQKTGGRIAELIVQPGAIGRMYGVRGVDVGEEGIDYYNALRQGELANILFEDVGNIMLLGRGAGLGSVAARAGGQLTRAGMPRLGTAVRRAGYFAEQPIAATIRGGARFAETALRTTPVSGRLGTLGARLAEGGRRISGSQTPLLETLSVARRGIDIRTQGQIARALQTENALKQEKAQAEAQGELFPEQKEVMLREATKTVETLQKRTAQAQRLRSFSQRAIREGESMKRSFVQGFTRYSSEGAVPDNIASLQRQLYAEQVRVNSGDTSRQPIVDHINRKIQAKELDPQGEVLNSEQMKNDAFAAAAIVGTRLIDIIKNQTDAGVSIPEAIARITPEELPVFVEDQGYRLTPSAVQIALDYADGRLDAPERVLERVSVDEALILLSSFDKFMEYRRRTGEGMVRGAGDPYERGQFPIPRYVLSALGQYKNVGPRIERLLDARVAQLLLGKYPQLLDELGIDPNSLTNPDGLFRLFAETPAQPDLYQIAYEAIQLAMPDLYATPQFRDFINDPLIFPAPMRIKVKAQQGVIQAMRGEDVVNIAKQLNGFATQFPDVLPRWIIQGIEKLVELSGDPQKRLDRESWVASRGLVSRIQRAITDAKNKITKEVGVLNQKMDERWARLDEISAATQSALGMIQTIIDSPELFADQAQVAEAARLRGVAEQAATGIEQLGTINEPKNVRLRSSVIQESERLTKERSESVSQLQANDREIRSAERELADAEALTPDDIARLEGERDIAIEVEKEIQAPPVTETQARAELDRRLTELKREEATALQFFRRFGSFMKRDLSEDIRAAIEQGITGSGSKKIYDAFVRKFTKPKTPQGFNARVLEGRESPYTDTGWDSFGAQAADLLGNPDLDAASAITELARRFQDYYELRQQRIDLARNASIEDIRREMQEALDAEIDRYRQEQYRELDLVDESGVGITPDDFTRMIENARNTDVLRLRVENLRRRSRELSARIAEIDQTLETNARDLEALGLMSERTMLRGEERRATEQAAQLESTALRGQQEAVKARLKGVGRIVPGEQKPPVREINMAQTGQPITIQGYRGTGSVGQRGIGEDSILGPGLYVAPTIELAQDYARDYTQTGNPIVGQVSQTEVSLRNPLVVASTQEWTNLTRAAGWEFPNPRRFSTPDPGGVLARQDIARLRAYVESLGHDGIIIKTMGTSGGFASILGGDQVVVFNPESMPTGTTPEPRLQRQFAGPIESEIANLETKQAKDQAAVQQLRESFARQDEALASAQQVAETPLLAETERARSMVGEGEAPLYIPAGASRLVTPVSQIDMALQAEGIAPETIGPFERMRQGTIIPLTAGQVAARVSESMNVLTRNIVMQRIITEGGFVSTVAQVIPIERRTAMMDQATQIADRSGRSMNTRQRQTLIESEYQKLLFDELQKQGLDPISPVAMPDPMDVYAERAALGALDERVEYTQIDDNTMVMPRGMRQGLASQFQTIGTGPPELRGAWEWASRQTAGWKSQVLPFSIRWQVGDHISNILNAWIRGDVSPAEMYRLMPEVLGRMQGEGMTRGELMFGQGAEGFLVDPVMQAMESLGLQSSGQRLADLREMRKGTLVSPPTMVGGRRFTFPRTRQRSFAFNEFQNRWVRHTLAFKKLNDILDAQGRSINEVTPTSVQSDPVLYEAVREAVESANESLGNFSQLTEFERRYVRSVYPFWAWVKFINKAAGQLLITQPDRVLFAAHLGGLTMEPEAEGMWEFLRGTSSTPLGLVDLAFLNPYSDSILFARNPAAAFVEQFTNLSPAITVPATAAGEAYYGMTGRRAPLLPTLSRPSYLEGRPGETTRSAGDVLGGIGYFGLKTFGGPYRNILDVTPSRIPLIAPEGRIIGTDVAVGPGQRFGQGSLRTTGPYAERRLSPNIGRLSAVMRTFGVPSPLSESAVAERLASQGVRRGRQAYLRRLKERREATRRLSTQ